MPKSYCFIGSIILILSVASWAGAEIQIDLTAIKLIESSNNYLAYNSQTRCYGLYQISEICLKDFNQLRPAHYKPRDLFDPVVNKKIAAWYFKRIEQMLESYKIPVSLTTVIAAYNWGIGNVLDWHKNSARFKDLPAVTRRYIIKYKELTRRYSRQ